MNLYIWQVLVKAVVFKLFEYNNRFQNRIFVEGILFYGTFIIRLSEYRVKNADVIGNLK